MRLKNQMSALRKENIFLKQLLNKENPSILEMINNEIESKKTRRKPKIIWKLSDLCVFVYISLCIVE